MKLLAPIHAVPESPLVLILPVERRGEERFGNPFHLLAVSGAADRLGAFLAFPEFEHTPWYADHPGGQVRQESEMIGDQVFDAERLAGRSFPATRRLLAGFSKSGWGAFSLLLRNPEVFGYAAAWDAPFQTERLGKWDLAAVFGSEENFLHHTIAYLCQQNPAPFQEKVRIILHGFNLFRADTEYAHTLFQKHAVLHRYQNDRKSAHAWEMDWLWPLLTELMGIYRQGNLL